MLTSWVVELRRFCPVLRVVRLRRWRRARARAPAAHRGARRQRVRRRARATWSRARRRCACAAHAAALALPRARRGPQDQEREDGHARGGRARAVRAQAAAHGHAAPEQPARAVGAAPLPLPRRVHARAAFDTASTSRAPRSTSDARPRRTATQACCASSACAGSSPRSSSRSRPLEPRSPCKLSELPALWYKALLLRDGAGSACPARSLSCGRRRGGRGRRGARAARAARARWRGGGRRGGGRRDGGRDDEEAARGAARALGADAAAPNEFKRLQSLHDAAAQVLQPPVPASGRRSRARRGGPSGVRSSNKMVLLDTLLPKLRAAGTAAPHLLAVHRDARRARRLLPPARLRPAARGSTARRTACSARSTCGSSTSPTRSILIFLMSTRAGARHQPADSRHASCTTRTGTRRSTCRRWAARTASARRGPCATPAHHRGHGRGARLRARAKLASTSSSAAARAAAARSSTGSTAPSCSTCSRDRRGSSPATARRRPPRSTRSSTARRRDGRRLRQADSASRVRKPGARRRRAAPRRSTPAITRRER